VVTLYVKKTLKIYPLNVEKDLEDVLFVKKSFLPAGTLNWFDFVNFPREIHNFDTQNMYLFNRFINNKLVEQQAISINALKATFEREKKLFQKGGKVVKINVCQFSTFTLSFFKCRYSISIFFNQGS